LTSVAVLTQAPVQSVVPVGHPHTPEVHTAPVTQTVPHAPQLLTSVDKLAQVVAPLKSVQAVVPVGHEQALEAHTCPPVQAVPQAPQLLASLVKLTQAPVQQVAVPLQQATAPHAPQRLPPLRRQLLHETMQWPCAPPPCPTQGAQKA
jgi:hypothetical protein